MNGGSQEYVSWVKEQTRPPELDKPRDTPTDTNDTQDSEDVNLKSKKKSHKSKKSSKHSTAKTQEFNKTFHLSEVNEDPNEETDNMEYFE